MNGIYLIIGGNMGDRLQTLHVCRKKIDVEIGKIIALSSIYETAAWGHTQQSAFLNQVLLVDTGLSAEDLLQNCLSIEKSMGRERTEKWSPRTIDIDILFYNDDIIHQDGLTIPHPRIQDRRFVLIPLDELAANEEHPVFHCRIQQLLQACDDDLEVRRLVNGCE